jgi:perosamine synthetase
VTPPIRVTEVHLGPRAEALVTDVLRSGQLAQGPMVARFEDGFREVVGTGHAVAVSSGTTALTVTLEALGVGPGDEIVTTPWTFVATLNAVLQRGARARLVDIRADDYTMDPEALAAALGSSTRAVLPVHLYGHPADMAAIVPMAEGAGLAVVEDAAQAHGASVDGRPVGSFGVGCFSFYATKNVTTGEGGMVTTDDEELAEAVRTLRNQGMRQRYAYQVPGHNHRMTDLQAAIGVAELDDLAERTGRRRANAVRLSAGLIGIPGLVTPTERPGCTHVYHQYTVRITEDARLDRDTVAKELETLGVGTGIYYPRPLHDYDCYRHHPAVQVDPVPEAERAARQVLSLPVHPWLGHRDLDRIITAVRGLLGEPSPPPRPAPSHPRPER